MRWPAQSCSTLRFVAALWLLTGCASDEPWGVPVVDHVVFEEQVYPVLLRDCAFPTCHGSEERFFRVWGPGRVRLVAGTAAFDPVTDNEVNASFTRASSLIDANDPSRSLLLRKPLAVGAGGAGHLGADKFGRNVYRSTDSPGYLTLSRWVFSVSRP